MTAAESGEVPSDAGSAPAPGPADAGVAPAHAPADEALRQAREQFQKVVNTVSDYAIFLLDAQGRVASWNAGAERIKGYRAVEIIGRDFSVFYPSDAIAAEWPARELLSAREGGRFEDEGWRIRKDGSRFWANVVISALYGPDREVRGFLKITRDLTARREVEEELRRTRTELEQRVVQRTADLERVVQQLRDQDRSKDHFLAVLAHELRNPLAPIRSVIEMLRHTQPEPEESQHALKIVERQTLQLTRLVDDLLDMARMTRNAITLERRVFDVRDVLQDAIAAAQPLVQQCGQQLISRLPPHPLTLEGDSARLTQVFGNLLNNASKFTPRRGTILVSATRQPETIVVAVSDTGSGMTADEIARAFEMFVQLDPQRGGQQSGLGLGLTLARHIVELHGGRIDARSGGRGLGTEVRVSLPASAQATVSAEPAGPVATVRSRNVLLVDDNVDGLEAMSMILTRFGHTVRTALDGEIALAEAEAFRPEVVILDIGLPGITGYELAMRLRQMPAGESMILVAVTGWGQPADRDRARDAGFDYHMTKPADAAALQDVLAGGRPPGFVAIKPRR